MSTIQKSYKESIREQISQYVDAQIVAQENENWERCAELQELIDELESFI